MLASLMHLCRLLNVRSLFFSWIFPPFSRQNRYDDHLIRESQTPMRRMGWHRHLKAGLVEGDIAERKPFKPSKNAKSIKTSSSIMFRNMRV